MRLLLRAAIVAVLLAPVLEAAREIDAASRATYRAMDAGTATP